MKKKLLFSLFAIGLLTFNFKFNSHGNSEENLLLKNISLMQANAFEVMCEATDDSSCTYTVAGIATGQSYSPMVMYP